MTTPWSVQEVPSSLIRQTTERNLTVFHINNAEPRTGTPWRWEAEIPPCGSTRFPSHPAVLHYHHRLQRLTLTFLSVREHRHHLIHPVLHSRAQQRTWHMESIQGTSAESMDSIYRWKDTVMMQEERALAEKMLFKGSENEGPTPPLSLRTFGIRTLMIC